ncbi:MAG: LCCL domain-containing protein, partial [Anaerolineae bacterium]
MKIAIRGCLFTCILLALVLPVQMVNAQSPTPVPLTWPGYTGGHGGHIGEHFSYYCPPFDPNKGYIEGGNLYGTDLYTDNSGICGAAVHAGVITTASGGTVTIEIRPATSSYTGSTRNGVTSHNWTEPNPSQNVAYAFSTGGAAGTP